jgi:hypothetical protein
MKKRSKLGTTLSILTDTRVTEIIATGEYWR